MIDWTAFSWSGAALLLVALACWLFSLLRNDVSIVDSLWSLMFLLVALVYATVIELAGPREALILILVTVWALRLSVYITWRNHGHPEDHRYQEIRSNNEPGFRYKSLYIVFWPGLSACRWQLQLVGSQPSGFSIMWLLPCSWSVLFLKPWATCN